MQILQRAVVFDDARNVEVACHIEGADLEGAQVVHPGEGTVLNGGQLGQVTDVQFAEPGRCGQAAVSDQTQGVVGQPQGAQLRKDEATAKSNLNNIPTFLYKETFKESITVPIKFNAKFILIHFDFCITIVCA